MKKVEYRIYLNPESLKTLISKHKSLGQKFTVDHVVNQAVDARAFSIKSASGKFFGAGPMFEGLESGLIKIPSESWERQIHFNEELIESIGVPKGHLCGFNKMKDSDNDQIDALVYGMYRPPALPPSSNGTWVKGFPNFGPIIFMMIFLFTILWWFIWRP